jgi:putative addiction module component (TIGR02574 family)
MMIVEQIPAINTLSIEEKYLLVNELWKDIEGNEALLPLSSAVEQLLEKRQKEYQANPDHVISWEEIKEKLKNR